MMQPSRMGKTWRSSGRIRNACLIVAVGTFPALGCKPQSQGVEGLVGVFGTTGLAPGSFHYPRAIGAAPDGRVFVIDKTGRVQRFGADGEYETHWSMPEFEKGKPVGMAVHPDGRVFVADTHYHRVLVYDRDGRLLTSFGEPGFGAGQFQLPTDVAFDRAGNVFVGEYYGNDRITQWSVDLKFVRSLADQPVEGKPLRRPAGMQFDDQDTLWVTDACNHRVIRFSHDGDVLLTFGEFGTGPGQMRFPYDLAITDDGAIVVCEFEGARLQWFSREGKPLRAWGRHGRRRGELFAPWGVTRGISGTLYVVDSLNNRVQIVSP